MQSISASQQENTEGTKLYIIMAPGMEYNDEYYYQSDFEVNTNNKAYPTEQAALDGLKEAFKEWAGKYELGDLCGEGEVGEDTDYMDPAIYNLYWQPHGKALADEWAEVAKAKYLSEHPGSSYWFGSYHNPWTKFDGFIDWAEENGIDWTPYINPKTYLNIHEITLV